MKCASCSGIVFSLRAPASEALAHMVPRRERRRASRVATGIEARLTGADGTSLALQLEDLSVIGLRGIAERELAKGTRCAIELRADGATIEARGTIARSQGRSLAVCFEELPYESYEHLRAFLLSHADDPAVISDELSDRLGFLREG